jgi:hypothetical protein
MIGMRTQAGLCQHRAQGRSSRQRSSASGREGRQAQVPNPKPSRKSRSDHPQSQKRRNLTAAFVSQNGQVSVMICFQGHWRPQAQKGLGPGDPPVLTGVCWIATMWPEGSRNRNGRPNLGRKRSRIFSLGHSGVAWSCTRQLDAPGAVVPAEFPAFWVCGVRICTILVNNPKLLARYAMNFVCKKFPHGSPRCPRRPRRAQPRKGSRGTMLLIRIDLRRSSIIILIINITFLLIISSTTRAKRAPTFQIWLEPPRPGSGHLSP